MVGRLRSWQGEQSAPRMSREHTWALHTKPKALVGPWAHSPVFWKGGEGKQSGVEQGWVRTGVCQVIRNGLRVPPSPTRAGTSRFLPGNLGLGSQSAGGFLLQVLAFLSGGAPSQPCREASNASDALPGCTQKPSGMVGFATVAVGSPPVGVGFGGGRWGLARAPLLPRLRPPAPAPSHCTTPRR